MDKASFAPHRWTDLVPAEEGAPLAEETLFSEISRLSSRAAAAKAEALWLGKPAPRYTSYPCATSFHEGVDTAAYLTSLAALPEAEPVSVYLHIPFCRSLCLYCGCNTSVTHGDERVDSYVSALTHEIQKLATHNQMPHRISRVHFGGGTPNILTPRALEMLFEELHRNFSFSFADEIAMELDPRLVSPAFVKALSACGISRVSLGVQDFNPDVQRVIRREQSYDRIAQVVDMLRSAGIVHINFDLIYGLPLQTPDSVAHTAALAASLSPSRLALYSYAHVPRIKKHQKVLEASGLPGKYALLALEGAARATLIAAGYRPLGMDHFAQETDSLVKAYQTGRLHRNFQGYTDDQARVLLGFGASSIGRTPDGFFQNEREPRFYEKKVWEDEALPIVRGVMISGEDRVRAAIIERLMCYLFCDVQEVCRLYDFSLANFSAEFEALKPYEEAGLIECKGYQIKLVAPQRMAIRVIAQVFDSASQAGAPSSKIG